MITQAHAADPGSVDVNRLVFVDDPRLEHDWPQSAHDWQTLAYCGACGLATLRLFIHSAAWVVRRVERIEFLDDWTVRRKVSLDYVVPAGGPVLQCPDGTHLRLLPLALMRRKTLVNFDFHSPRGGQCRYSGFARIKLSPWASFAPGRPSGGEGGASPAPAGQGIRGEV